MRKVHYKVVLDVFIHEDECCNVRECILDSNFYPEIDGDGNEFDVMDINVDSVNVDDSR